MIWRVFLFLLILSMGLGSLVAGLEQVTASDDFGGKLIAKLQEGKVSVYQLESDPDCFVVVGELHGKTVSGFCK